MIIQISKSPKSKPRFAFVSLRQYINQICCADGKEIKSRNDRMGTSEHSISALSSFKVPHCGILHNVLAYSIFMTGERLTTSLNSFTFVAPIVPNYITSSIETHLNSIRLYTKYVVYKRNPLLNASKFRIFDKTKFCNYPYLNPPKIPHHPLIQLRPLLIERLLPRIIRHSKHP